MQTRSRRLISILLTLLMMAGVIAVAPVMAHAAQAPTITTTSLPEGAVGVPYSVTLEATGDTPITWSLAVDGDPHWGGLTLNPDTGAITGTPTAAGPYAFTVVATNAAGSDTKDLSFEIISITYPPIRVRIRMFFASVIGKILRFFGIDYPEFN